MDSLNLVRGALRIEKMGDKKKKINSSGTGNEEIKLKTANAIKVNFLYCTIKK